MRIYRTLLFPVAYLLIAVFWLSTFVILGDAPLLDGPQDEADRALAFFLWRTTITFCLLVAVVVLQQLTRRWVAGKPKGVGSLLD
jgi:hypothetical protein